VAAVEEETDATDVGVAVEMVQMDLDMVQGDVVHTLLAEDVQQEEVEEEQQLCFSHHLE
jgi:hypothetical protein|tara:strand:- start:106 stop:282 length:177 start_codon:yes stop_codon:yes gene_type:complete